MCGIAGVVSLDGRPIEPGLAGRMRDRILHRGPDGSGEYEAQGVSLAACRLAIVDLDPRGRMPMATPDGRYHIVHNGEIYNRLELRHELEQRGVALRTTTDTEVLLYLWALDGKRMLERLDGMFAFAIWDAQRRELFAARDRAGEKPFFGAVHGGRLYFASEPKALFAGGVPCAFDETTWPELLVFRSVAGRRTPYRGVERLLPGHWLRVHDGAIENGRWWRFPVDGDSAAPVDPRQLAPIFEASIERRLIADVPVGVLLSGGLDSSSVTAIAAAQAGRPLPAFTVRYDGTDADEGPFATAVAKATGVEHHEVRVDPRELPPLIADAAWHHDEPLAFLASPDLLAVSRYARRHVRVLLTGESSDELFGGYGRLRLFRYPWLVRSVGRLLVPFETRLRPGSRGRRAAAASRVSGTDWVTLTNAARDPATITRAALAEWASYRSEVAAEAARSYRQPVRQALDYERHTHLPAVLDHCDRQTMGAAIEARLPFLDPRLLAIAALARPADLFRGPDGKQLLRDAMVGRLPKQVLERRKRGWTSPYQLYLRQVPELRDWLMGVPDHDIIAGSPVGTARARAAVDRFLAGEGGESAYLAWQLGRVALWHQVCVEGIRQPFAEPARRSRAAA